jgi:mannose-6-phosphate isomerase-like protein (cupin superfamily)
VVSSMTFPHRVDVLTEKVEFADWAVFIMNWESRFAPSEVGDIERHNETDEVFVLIHGRSLLYVMSEDGLHAFDMKPCVMYNVTKGTWHSVIGNQNTRWLIVESRNTSLSNTNHRQLTETEMDELKKQYPNWVRKSI